MKSARVAFSWYGLPQYAARQIREAINSINETCVVVGSRPVVPVSGMEEALGQPIVWVDPDSAVGWSEIGLSPPQVFIQSGWSYPAFAALGRDAKRYGGRIIGLADLNARDDFRQNYLGPIAFRLLYRRHFDAMIVAGAQGRRVMRRFGMPETSLREGLYGADSALFPAGPRLVNRSRTFLFVGRFEPVKNVMGLIDAFIRFSVQRPGWTLRLCGSGAQRELIPDHPSIVVEDFIQPQALSSRYHDARFFVLPSVREAWGLVVHEASLSGCALVLSDQVGSSSDLASSANSIVFRAGDVDALVAALIHAADRPVEWLEGARSESLHLASRFGPKRFAQAVTSLASSYLAGVK